MRKALVFIGLLLLFLIWTFPHEQLVRRLILPRAAALGVGLTFDDVSFGFPFTYTLSGVEVTRGAYRVTLASTRLGFGLDGDVSLDINACGGELSGRLSREDSPQAGNALNLYVSFEGVNPGLCLDLGSLEVRGRFDGELQLAGLATSGPRGRALPAGSGALNLKSDSGKISGALPAAPARRGTTAQRPGFPLGEWTFSNLEAASTLQAGTVNISKLNMYVEGVEWRLTKGKLSPATSGETRLRCDLRARKVEDDARSKALLGLLPKAGEDRDGWRRYTLTGTLSAPKLVGLK